MRWTILAVVVVILSVTSPVGGQEIFADGFEWGSVCAWSNDRWYIDLDIDGFGDSSDPGVPSDCPVLGGLVENNLDCDDADEEVCPGADELCDGVDNDCDPDSADGAGDPLDGTACDGADTDLCLEGVTVCDGGFLVCTDETDSLLDVCDGFDNDCDPVSADGSEDPLAGSACDGADTDLCPEGERLCSDGILVCTDETDSLLDVCDGFDNDCDPASADGSEDPRVGEACDGTDTDLCLEGEQLCSGGFLVCSDQTDSLLDVCDGFDNDCDPVSPDGSEDPLVGGACDGGDSDLCMDGQRFCSDGSLACSDPPDDFIDVCDGLDNDCDPASADGSEDPMDGAACDGADTDLCLEGVFACSGGVLQCSDTSDNSVELCDGLDNDCDGQFDEDWSCSFVSDGCCPAACDPTNDADC